MGLDSGHVTPGVIGCDVPGHPNNFAHVCAEWDVANAIAERWGVTLIHDDEDEPDGE